MLRSYDCPCGQVISLDTLRVVMMCLTAQLEGTGQSYHNFCDSKIITASKASPLNSKLKIPEAMPRNLVGTGVPDCPREPHDKRLAGISPLANIFARGSREPAPVALLAKCEPTRAPCKTKRRHISVSARRVRLRPPRPAEKEKPPRTRWFFFFW